MGFPLQLAWDQATVVLLVFAGALLFVDAYDIELPRGDRMGVASPLIGALVVLVSSPLAMMVAVASVVVVRAVKERSGARHQIVSDVFVRASATVAAYITHALLRGTRVEVTAVVVVPAICILTDLAARQVAASIGTGRSLRGLVVGNASRQALFLAAQLSVAALTIVTQASMGVWSLVPVVALLMLMQQAYSMLLELRETYLATVELLIEAAEAQRPEEAGHSDRTAAIARAIGSKCALSAADTERVGYAALLHNIGRISSSTDDRESGRSADVIRDVEFLSDVLPVLEILDSKDWRAGGEDDVSLAFIVALASDIDLLEGGRQSNDAPVTARLLSGAVPARVKATAVSAALEMGHRVPAID